MDSMKESDKNQIVWFYNKKPRNPTADESNQRAKKVAKIFSEYKFNKILDIGCSDCSFSVILKNVSNADEVYGIDVYENAVKCGLERGVKVIQVDIDKDNFPFEDNFFDAVYCGEVIEHLFDPDHLLDEIHRISKRDALCVITTPNLASLFNRIALSFGYQPYFTEVSLKYKLGHFLYSSKHIAGHIRNFTYRSFLQLVQMHSFNIEKTLGYQIEDLPFPVNILDAFVSRFPSLSLGCIVVAKCKK